MTGGQNAFARSGRARLGFSAVIGEAAVSNRNGRRNYCVSGSSISDSCRTTITIPESVTWNRRLSASMS
jgi:hypothetical protein